MKSGCSKLFCGLVLLSALSALRGASPDESRFETARRAQNNGRYAQAEAAYRGFLAQHPQSVPALTNLGVVLAHEGQFQAAIASYKNALQIDPAATPAKINLALAYYRTSKWANAAEVLQDFAVQNPTDRRAIQLLAICDMQLKKFGDAVNEYRKLTPTDDASILVGLSSALREAGNRTESEQVLASVLEEHPDSPEVQYLIGLAQFARDEYAAAAVSFSRVIDLAPARADGYFYLGATYLKQRKLDAAVHAWRQAVQVDPRYFPATFTLGALLAEMDRYAEAQPLLQNALTQRPDDAATQLEMGRLLLHQGEPAQALTLLKRAAAQDPKSKQASFLLATTYQRLGRKNEAQAEFRRSRQLFSQDVADSMLAEADRVSRERAP